MTDKTMGVEEGTRINYLKAGGKTVADPSPLAMRREQAAFMAVNPTIDKDAIEERLQTTRGRIRREAKSIRPGLQSGNPIETAKAQRAFDALMAFRGNISRLSTSSALVPQAQEPMMDAVSVLASTPAEKSFADKTIARLVSWVPRMLKHGQGQEEIDRMFHQVIDTRTRDFSPATFEPIPVSAPGKHKK